MYRIKVCPSQAGIHGQLTSLILPSRSLSFTRFQCISFATNITSVLNLSSPSPRPDLRESLFTAISHPLDSFPWGVIQVCLCY